MFGFCSPDRITYPLGEHCPRSRSLVEQCPGGTAAASPRRCRRYFRDPRRRCWTTSTCRSHARSWGKTSRRSASGQAPGSAQIAPPPAGRATFPRLSLPRYPAASPGSALCRSRPGRTRSSRKKSPRPAGFVDTPSRNPAASSAAWPGAAVGAPPLKLRVRGDVWRRGSGYGGGGVGESVSSAYETALQEKKREADGGPARVAGQCLMETWGQGFSRLVKPFCWQMKEGGGAWALSPALNKDREAEVPNSR